MRKFEDPGCWSTSMGFREDRETLRGAGAKAVPTEVSGALHGRLSQAALPGRSLAARAARVGWRSEQGRHEHSPVVQAADLTRI